MIDHNRTYQMKRVFSYLFLSFTLCATYAPLAMGQQFGGSVLVHDQTILAGDGQSQVLPGIVYVYSADPASSSNSTWNEQDRIMSPSSSDSADGFGASMALSGNLLIVGAPKAQSVHLFEWNGSAWTYVSSVSNDTPGFGSVVAINEQMAAVASPGNAETPGSVWTFMMDPNGFLKQEAVFSQELDDLNSQFGASLALIENKLLVGAPGANQNAGRVVLAERNPNGTWNEVGPLPGIQSAEGALTGSVMAASGNRLAVGAPGFANRSGTVWYFELNDGSFELQTRLSPFSSSRNDLFGSSIALGANTLWVGSPGEGGRSGTGAVYEFDLNAEGHPAGTRKLEVADLATGSAFGS